MESNWQKILSFWFEKPLDFNKWFHSKTKYDSYIVENFKDLLKEAEDGNLLHWLGNKNSYLAYIILMDQFSRHIYRGTAAAYKNDGKVLLFTEMGFHLYEEKLTAVEKMFVLMPYQHSENLKIQKLGVKILNNLVKNEKNVSEKNILKKALFHQKEHCKVIEKFGRFPKRNEFIGRVSSEEEIDYIDENDEFDY